MSSNTSSILEGIHLTSPLVRLRDADQYICFLILKAHLIVIRTTYSKRDAPRAILNGWRDYIMVKMMRLALPCASKSLRVMISFIGEYLYVYAEYVLRRS